MVSDAQVIIYSWKIHIFHVIGASYLRCANALLILIPIFLQQFVPATIRLLRYKRVYLPLCKVADTPFHSQGDELLSRLPSLPIIIIVRGSPIS